MRWALLAALCACGGAPGLETGALEQPIVGGAIDSADPEVFMIQFELFGLPNMCSAVLIGQRTLLTASHCAGLGTNFRAVNAAHGRGAPAIDIVDIRTHPGWSLGTASGKDLALALLKTAPPGVAPKPRATAPPPAGGLLRVVGYGYTEEEDYTSWGDKHAIEVPARTVDASFITLGDQVAKGFCNGDSGGPSFHRFPDGVERLVGIHIEGPTCTDGRDLRVDVHAAFIDTYLSEKEGGSTVTEPPTHVEGAVPTRALPPPPVGTAPEPKVIAPVEPEERVFLRSGCGCDQAGLWPLCALLALLCIHRR